jgi:hypothetical protein
MVCKSKAEGQGFGFSKAYEPGKPDNSINPKELKTGRAWVATQRDFSSFIDQRNPSPK